MKKSGAIIIIVILWASGYARDLRAQPLPSVLRVGVVFDGPWDRNIDPVRQHLPVQSGRSGVKNLSYLVYPQTFFRDYPLIRELTPFRKLVFLTSRRYHEGIGSIRPSDADVCKIIGSDYVTVRYDERADDALSAIPADADAVYLDFVPLSSIEFGKLARGLIGRRLPSFSMAGETEVQKGIMAAANLDIFPRLVRRIALNVHRIFMGEDPGTLAVAFPAARRLFINQTTAYAVGVSPKWNTLMEAELVQLDSSEIAGALHYSLLEVVQRIVEDNPDVQARIHEVSAGERNIGIARASLLPRIDLSISGLQIDQGRARLGMQPERRGTADVSFSQVLFSEPAIANLSIQSSLQLSRENEFQLARLNVVADGATMYLNCLRTRKTYYIMLNNLKLTRSNLELAQIRQSTGSAGPEEPLRWEVQIASLRKSVMDVNTQMNQTLLALKQAMNIPLEYKVNVDDVSLNDPALLVSDKRLLDYFEDPLSFERLTNFFVKEGLANSCELLQLDAVIAAQERSLSSIRNSFLLPTVTAFGGYTNTFYKSALSSPYNLANLPAAPQSLPAELPLYLCRFFSALSGVVPDRHDWNVGLQLAFNIFQGFSSAEHENQQNETLRQYKVQRSASSEKIALRIRSQMESVKAAYFAAQQSLLEQQAAGKGLDLVTDAYSQGAVPILNLLDAQNTSLNADLVAANTYYDFFIAYIQLERAIGGFDLMMTPEARQEFSDRIMQSMKASTSVRD